MQRWAVLVGASALWLAPITHSQMAPGELLAAVDGSVAALPDAQAETQLNHDLRVSGISSRVEGGVATLEGIVSSEADKTRAEQLARRAHGITHVQSRIIVTGEVSESVHAGAPLAPALDATVHARLQADARLGGSDIDVRVDSRKAVTLRGEVDSELDKAIAGRIAADTPSVTEVRNRLVVEPN